MSRSETRCAPEYLLLLYCVFRGSSASTYGWHGLVHCGRPLLSIHSLSIMHIASADCHSTFEERRKGWKVLRECDASLGLKIPCETVQLGVLVIHAFSRPVYIGKRMQTDEVTGTKCLICAFIPVVYVRLRCFECALVS